MKNRRIYYIDYFESDYYEKPYEDDSFRFLRLLTVSRRVMSRFSPEMLMQLKEINLKRENTNAENARITMEELGEAKD